MPETARMRTAINGERCRNIVQAICAIERRDKRRKITQANKEKTTLRTGLKRSDTHYQGKYPGNEQRNEQENEQGESRVKRQSRGRANVTISDIGHQRSRAHQKLVAWDEKCTRLQEPSTRGQLQSTCPSSAAYTTESDMRQNVV